MLYGLIDYILLNVYDFIDEELIYNLVSKIKGLVGLFGMDVELYKRILCFKNFKIEGKILREELVVFIRNLLRKLYYLFLFEVFMFCRFILFDKNLGIRLIGVGEVLRRIVGKMVSGFLKEEIKEVVGFL